MTAENDSVLEAIQRRREALEAVRPTLLTEQAAVQERIDDVDAELDRLQQARSLLSGESELDSDAPAAGRPSSQAPPPEPSQPDDSPAERKQPGELVGGDRNGRGAAQEASLQGRILSYLTLNAGATGPGIALGIGVPLNDVRPELGKLIRESEVRTHRRNGDVVYVPVG